MLPYQHFAEYDSAIAESKKLLPDLSGKTILEAGCGSASRFDLTQSYVVGIDISQDQLNRHQTLKEKICADLLTYDNPQWANRFDVIICWDVLEHLKQPGKVINQFKKWLKPDGVMIIAYPNPQTLKGFVTKYTPLFVHDLFYLFASGRPLFTKGDVGPFKTYFAKDIYFKNFLKQLNQINLKINWLASAESYQNKFLKKFVPAPVVDFLNKILAWPLLKTLHHSANDFIFLIKHQPAN